MKHFLKTAAYAAVAAAAAATSGCAYFDHKREVAAVETKVEAKHAEFMMPPSSPQVTDTQGFWVNKRATLHREDLLPAEFRSPVQFCFERKASVRDVAALLTRETNLRFTYESEATGDSGVAVIPAGYRNEDTLKETLDRIAALAGISWRYADGTVNFFKYDVQIFQISATPGSTQFTSTSSNTNNSGSTQGGGATGGSTSSVGLTSTFKATQDFWAGMKEDLKALLGADAKYSLSESNQTLTVRATPQTLSMVESYIKNLNARQSKQIAITVRIFSVANNDAGDIGASMNVVYKSLTGNNTYSLTPLGGSTTGLTAFTASVVNPASPFVNSSAVVNALDTLGKTSIEVDTVKVVNAGVPTVLNDLHTVSYLAMETSTAVSNAGNQVSLTPGTVSEGLAINWIPVVLDGNKVRLHQDLSITTLDSIKQAGVSPNIIQVPETSSRTMSDDYTIESGTTLFYGFRTNTTATTTNRGIMDLEGTSTKNGKTVVVMVTPHILAAH